jgi:hypothetical protein
MGLSMTIVFVMAFLGFSGAAAAQPTHVSKYAGQETRAIKSLSSDDIAELRRGGGWGLARAAELNGVPGPTHLLEMKNAIPLSEAQIGAIAAIKQEMTRKAVAQGETLIMLEGRLDRHFSDGTITDEILRALLAEIADARRALRYIHLSTHLKTPEILSKAQIGKYNALRGYSANPCANIPAGHNADMWRKHNKCG